MSWILRFQIKKKKKSEVKAYLFSTCRFTSWVKGDMNVLWRPHNEATIKYTSECERCIWNIQKTDPVLKAKMTREPRLGTSSEELMNVNCKSGKVNVWIFWGRFFPSPAWVKDMVNGNSQLQTGILKMRYNRKNLNKSKRQGMGEKEVGWGERKEEGFLCCFL